MIREAIDRILALGKPEIIDVQEGGYTRKFSTGAITPIVRSMPEPLEIHSLQGLIDYLYFEHGIAFNGVRETMDDPSMALFVENHARVVLHGRLLVPEWQRECQIIAQFGAVTQLFGKNMPVEEFIIWLQSRFTESPDREKVIKVVGNLSAGFEANVKDDGFTQRVTVSAGVTRREEVDCPNPVFLRPFCTFNEVEQSLRPFILRVKSGKDEPVMAALHEADGGAWMVQARANIAAWLRERTNVPVIA